MSWASAIPKAEKSSSSTLTTAVLSKIDLKAIITVDFETYYDKDFTLRKLSTSEYIRDSRFKVHMAGIKIGTGPVKVYSGEKLALFFKNIDWACHDILCHNAAFDGFILSHHYRVLPRRYYDTLCMARGLHGNDIRANLDAVAQYYNVGNKIPNVLENSQGVLSLDKTQYKAMSEYCAEDVRLTFEIFKQMLVAYPATELELIDLTVRMFCEPLLHVDIKRVEIELARELKEKETKLLSMIGDENMQARVIELKHGLDGALEHARQMVAKNESFADILRDSNVRPPTKDSPSTPGKEIYAFSKTDGDFIELLSHPDQRVRTAVECRLSVKSTTNETRAERFLKAGANDAKLPVLLLYYGAHTGRLSGGNKMNMQNLKRGGELRRSILAPKGHHIVVADSGQIEARVNAWLSGQADLLYDFRQYDLGLDRDAYCKFADLIYDRVITEEDKLERFVGKVCILGLGYQMGAPKLQGTLAVGAMGPAVFIELDTCYTLVNTYRAKNDKIKKFWGVCSKIIEDMSAGRTGSYKCISWERERIQLPNGMSLKYPGLRKKETENGVSYSYLRKGAMAHIYGGLLCENIVQALARIIVCDQMLAVNKKWRVTMMTHDEIVAIAPVKQAAKCFAEMKSIMSQAPAWCADLPLAAAGGHDINYSK